MFVLMEVVYHNYYGALLYGGYMEVHVQLYLHKKTTSGHAQRKCMVIMEHWKPLARLDTLTKTTVSISEATNL